MGDLFGAVTGASKKAARRQVRAAEDANNDLGRARDQILKSLEPQINYGNTARDQLMQYLGIAGDANADNYGSLLKPFTGEDLASTPGYQFGLEQGQMGLDRKASAAGRYLSGAALKAATQFGQDYAGTKFQEGYNRDATDKARIAAYLGSASDMGANALNNANNTRYNASVQYGNNTMGAGNAAAAGIMGQANAWGNVINSGLGLGLTAASMGAFGGLGGATPAVSSGGVNSALPGFSTNLYSASPGFTSNYLLGGF